jgi:hypothetical protein
VVGGFSIDDAVVGAGVGGVTGAGIAGAGIIGDVGIGERGAMREDGGGADLFRRSLSDGYATIAVRFPSIGVIASAPYAQAPCCFSSLRNASVRISVTLVASSVCRVAAT